MSLTSAAGPSAGHLVTDGLITLAVFAAYFAPTAIAVIRKTDDRLRVFLINLLTGWLIAGWIVALILAFAGHARPEYPPAQYGYYRPGRRQGP